MNIRVNGKTESIARKPTLAEYLAGKGIASERAVVERNTRIVKRADYGSTILEDGDQLEILSFVGGG